MDSDTILDGDTPIQDMDSGTILDGIQDMDTRRPVASEEDIAKLFTEVLPYEEL